MAADSGSTPGTGFGGLVSGASNPMDAQQLIPGVTPAGRAATHNQARGLMDLLDRQRQAVTAGANEGAKHGLGAGLGTGLQTLLHGQSGESQAQTRAEIRARLGLPGDDERAQLGGFRGGVDDFALDTVTDPVTLESLGLGILGRGGAKIAQGLSNAAVRTGAKVAPGATEGAQKLLATVAEKRSQFFNPEHHIRDLTEHGQNVVAAATNRANQAAAAAKRVEDKAIAEGRNAIKAGQIPAPVAAAFSKYGAAVPVGEKPSALRRLLDEARMAHAHAQAREELQNLGLLPPAAGGSVSAIAKPRVRTGTGTTVGPRPSVPFTVAGPTAKATSADGATGALLRKVRGQDTYASMVPNPSERLLALDAERAAAAEAAQKSGQSASAASGGLSARKPVARPQAATPTSKPFTLPAQPAGRVTPASGVTALELARNRGHDFFRDAATVDAAREGVAKHIRPDVGADTLGAKVVADVNRRLKSIFLAVPFPHMLNLTNLTYNKYGLGPTIRGLAYAAQEATGLRHAHLNELIAELQKAGGDYQYENLFGETNPVEPIRQLQRFGNAVQNKTLNPTERGLRASMLEHELGQGKPGVDAVRGVHKALGTDAPTEFTRFLNRLPLSQFPRFHTQTVLGSFGRTLAKHPERLLAFQRAFGGGTQDPDGQPHYHLTTPTAAGLRFAENPLNYFASGSTLGGLVNTTSPYSPLGLTLKASKQEQRGEHDAALKTERKAFAAWADTLFPSSGLIDAAVEDKGQAGESNTQDALSALFGGYWSTR